MRPQATVFIAHCHDDAGSAVVDQVRATVAPGLSVETTARGECNPWCQENLEPAGRAIDCWFDG
jgi:hypothetical protein